MELNIPFAETGNREDFPINATADQSLSLEKGYPIPYQLKPEEGGKFILRPEFNQMMYLATKEIVDWRTQTFPNWSAELSSGLKYKKTSIVKYTDSNVYISKIDNNNSIPGTDSNWGIFTGVSDRPIGNFDPQYIARDYHIVAFGGEFNRADYPLLWAWVQSNPTLLQTEANWQTENTANGMNGHYSSGNGTTTFRAPNLKEATFKFSDRGIATYEPDSIKAHHHTLTTLDGAITAYNQTGSNRLISYQNSLKDTSTVGTAKNKIENIAVLPLIIAK